MRIARHFLILFLLVIRVANAQDQIKQYVSANTIPISSIYPVITDFSDLVRMGDAIGDARIVMLGEQDHGDAASFLAKTRLIKYLHEQKGFNVLAFESDFFGLNYGWDGVSKTSPVIDSFLRKNIFPIWTACYGCTDLFYHYIPATYQTKTPLVISGFDNQLVLWYSYDRLALVMDSVLSALDLPITKRTDYRSFVLPMIDTLTKLQRNGIFDIEFHRRLRVCMEEIKKEVNSKLAPDNFWSRVADNMYSFKNASVTYEQDQNAAEKIRDAEMAKNLAWLTDHKFAGQKIIVWAHNQHIMKQPYPDQNDASLEMTRMGYYFTRDSAMMKNTYIIGFDSYQGKGGLVAASQPFNISLPYKDDFENWIDPKLPQAFVDFKAYNTNFPAATESFFMKGTWHRSSRMAWNKVFDGIFFIRDMFPCKE